MNNLLIASLHITLHPAFAAEILYAIGAATLIIIAYALWRRARGSLWRALALTLLFTALLNPSIVHEERSPLRDTALIVVDDSASMHIGERGAQVKAATDALTQKLAARKDIDIETLHVKGDDSTNLFQAITAKLATLPHDRIAGIIALTDGQVHDAQVHDTPTSTLPAPFHALIAGKRGEHDRRLIIKQAPAYGIVGKPVTVTLRIDDTPEDSGEKLPVMLTHEDGSAEEMTIPTGRDVSVEITPAHAGLNHFAFTTPDMQGEITPINNAALVSVNGIRERLRVLLVSGQPHIGERVWRDFLKSDPAVDLVHFTILRSMLSRDHTPDSELALVPFPVNELFDVKLNSFDLIILDRFRGGSVIPANYLTNIAKYVEDGGALLVSNPTDREAPALAASPLARVLPALQNGSVMTGSFVPEVTATGARHPVTSALEHIMPRGAWGPWFRQVGATNVHGDTVMTGAHGQPLLVLNHVGGGRVAEFMTDQFWLWTRGYNGGGPEAELLRRTVHWLMKEPELEEETLSAAATMTESGWNLTITKQTLHEENAAVDVEKPDGKTESVTLTSANNAALSGSLAVTDPGLYRITDAQHHATMALAGASASPEFGAMVATADILAPPAKASGGKIYWLEDGVPDAHLNKNGKYTVTGSKAWPLLPPLALVIILLSAVLWAWRVEGKR